jgi:hypothetical protein
MTDQVTPIRKPRKPRSAVSLLLQLAAMTEKDSFKVFYDLAKDDKFVNADLRSASEGVILHLEVLSNAANKIKNLASETVA